MSTTTMHFGPEWMRTKRQPPSRGSQQPPSPPPFANAPQPNASSYSALVSAPPILQHEDQDEAHPFKYSKQEMLRIFRESGGKSRLGLEVERWEGVVREVGSDPIGIRELSDTEKKLFSGPLNSDLRRRQSTDLLSPLNTGGGERPRLSHHSSATGSPLRERFGGLKRRDTAESPSSALPRKQSLSNLQPTALSTPRDGALPSPRIRTGYTPSFDGVLNSGESWVMRRRASEASKPSEAANNEDGDRSVDNKPLGIREERREDTGQPTQHNVKPDNGLNFSLSRQRSREAAHRPDFGGAEIHGIGAGFDQMNLNDSGSNVSSSVAAAVVNAGLPQGLQDLASVEWSYKDPSGQVQGPFRADLMQKWYDEGYFSPDLPMKRTHHDTQWITVQELGQRAGGDKIFLSPTVPVLPPGLSRRNESPLPPFNIPPSEQSGMSSPYQPSPMRSLRSSTLDSYLGSGSNPPDSPSSSLGAGRFRDSPDSSAFDGRIGANVYAGGDPSTSGRMPGLAGSTDFASPFTGRRDAFAESTLDNQATHYPVMGTMNGYGFSAGYNSVRGPWNPSSNMAPALVSNDIPFSGFRPAGDLTNLGPALPAVYGDIRISDEVAVDGIQGPSPLTARDAMSTGGYQSASLDGTQHPSFANFDVFDNTASGRSSQEQVQYENSSGQGFAPTQQLHQIPSLGQFSSYPANLGSGGIASASWNNIPEALPLRRPGPFEVGHSIAASTVPVMPAASSQQWGRLGQPSRASPTADASSWVSGSQGVIEDTWKQQPGTSSLTVSNVGQHNQQQQLQQQSVTTVPAVHEDSDNMAGISVEPEAAQSAALPNIDQSIQAKPKFKPASPAENQVQAPQAVDAVVHTSVPQKTPWAKEDEGKIAKAPGAAVSLREIQEAESRKIEARKVAERERERAVRSAGSTEVESKDELPTFTASWGLPISQAGARSAAIPRDVSVSPAPAAVTPPAVWTTTSKAPSSKKTMKEIQEEEERRKKLMAKETMAVAASRRAHAEPTNKITTMQGSVWTTVGPNGKASGPLPSPGVVVPPSRSLVPQSPSTTVAPTNTTVRPNGAGSRPTVAPAVLKPSTQGSRVEELSMSPSHDFLKWLNDSLKGLNSSVNVEEIMSMLLSFPLDPDRSTLELISDLIYSNSTTLNGRHFASEFVAKRKSDAAAHPKNVGGAGKSSTKPVSIADVVKAAPKATQPEWGFKVVNKKKKGGRV